ncbi:MAG: class I SAM-dependent methyltransferase, partial [Rhodocyclales bacterium GT-UBC]
MYDGYKKYGKEEASSYEEEREKEDHWWQEDQYVADYFRSNQPSEILDAPVGTGRFFHHYINAEKIIGIDISEQMLAESTKKLLNQHLKNISLQHADILKLDFLDNQFDLTICWRFAHLVPEELLGSALLELGRVTKGTILLQAYVAPPYWVRLLLALARLPNKLIRPLTGSSPPPPP